MYIEKVKKFTKREMEVLTLIGEGFSTKRIAQELFISINTVETHRRHLLEKMEAKNSVELIRLVTRAMWLNAS
ncbi:response regulator transcription factor [Mucilaginibacter sp. HC2]|uniref:response regulator transcription factor n=1 Tax=Mucilaginibacter inviolabilis TaxID=2714892 RepID=UPI00140B0B02|nr:LuxR C-terminal-related transcriptional regulator [Mucilaginibacter inviolabilis]NHA06141.1 response regulator transcription factor [Mucilaginibacter inviolabilis]